MYDIIGLLVAFFFGGIAIAILDRRIGVWARRLYYRMTRKDPLPESDRRGLITKQPARKKLQWASIISLVQTLGIVWSAGFNVNFLHELTMFVFETGFMMAGFYSAFPFLTFGSWLINKVAPQLDRIESGETTVGNLAGEAASKAASGVVGAVSDTASAVTKEVGEMFSVPEKVPASTESSADEDEEIEATPEEPPKPVKAAEPRPDPEEVLRKFKRGT